MYTIYTCCHSRARTADRTINGEFVVWDPGLGGRPGIQLQTVPPLAEIRL
eukprot:NODE_501_length_849_cov_312.081250_g442_i0.p3 GENE.NODE_501_length_849_cov_312.081250_g442_i0~~NODE_501_length_849_cov_312.081250_g442_i0.p3  ORF type:complete len:50 (-),score=0.55 NODE_501_length_849_cov_312.081250_g442_i0:608-757(-)